MIPEEYVTFETAKLLKAAGFPQDCETIYDSNGDWIAVSDSFPNDCAAPTQAQAMRWLREQRKLYIEIFYDLGFKRPPYFVEVQIIPEGEFINVDYPMAHATYEAAAEAGIQAACKYLIEKYNKDYLIVGLSPKSKIEKGGEI